MKTVTLDVRSPADAMAGFARAWRSGRAERSARISFESPELLWKVLTALLEAGVLERTATGGIVFPFEAVKVEFLLQAE